ncbi:MAG: methyltransferase domain-containing protein [Nitrospirota bacterium]
MEDVQCPICLNRKVFIKENKKIPSDFRFENFKGFSIFSCPDCLSEFAWPRYSMNYENVSEDFKVYKSFVSKEEFEGRIHHVLNCTSHWKDSPIVYHILSLLNFRSDFLDFAAGSGYMTELARRLGYKVNALEISDSFRKFIQKMIPTAAVYTSLDELIAPDKKFKVINAMHIIEHIAHPIDVLSNLHSILSPQGILIVVVPNLDRVYYRFGERGKEIEDQIEWDGVAGDFPPHHLTRFRAKTVKIALQKSGFRNVAIGYALVNVWDLFHHGLGDETFKFKDYFTDIKKMRLISSIEVRLNEIFSYLNLEYLGNSLIALASDGIEQPFLENLLHQGREQVMNTYVTSIQKQYEQFILDEGEKDKYIESLKQALESKDRLIEDSQKSLDEMLKEKHSYIKSLEEATREKDKYIESLKQALESKDRLIEDSQKSLDEMLKEKHSYIKSLEETVVEKIDILQKLYSVLEEKERNINNLQVVLEQKEDAIKKLSKKLSLKR